VSDPTPQLPGPGPGAPSEPVHPRPATPLPASAGKKRSDLALRLITAAFFIPLVIYAIWAGGLVFLGVVTAIVVLAQREVYGLVEDKGAHPLVGFGLAAGAGLPLIAFIGNEYHATLLMTATLLAVMVLQLGKAQTSEAMVSMSWTFFGVFYVGWLLSHAVPLRNFDRAVASKFGAGALAIAQVDSKSGIFLMIFTLAVVILCDAGAYFAGRAYGRRKLAPKVSPSKTVEGTIGGVLTAVLAGAVTKLIFDFFWPDASAMMNWIAMLVFSVVVAVAAVTGDLVESLLKRDAQVKDAGRLLPGMGGFLDRIDSALLGIPVMYYMVLFYVWVQVG
jgi:phosphatidate cytidylyltransferase